MKMNPVCASEIVPSDLPVESMACAALAAEVRVEVRRTLDEDDVPAVLRQVALAERREDGAGHEARAARARDRVRGAPSTTNVLVGLVMLGSMTLSTSCM